MSSLLDKISNAIPHPVKNFFSNSRQWIGRNSDWLFPWVAGGLAGLIIGLFIGWIAWPVQWTGMQLTDLSQPQKAAYISAVADAYILDGTGYSEVNMYTRLDGFGPALPDEVLAAIEYYRADPSVDQVQLANLAGLANDLGIPIDARALDTAAAPAQDAPASIGDAVAPVTVGEAVSEAAGEEGSAGIWMWLLALVVAGGLIGGGIYLLRYLSRVPRPSESLTSEPAPTLPGEMRAPQTVATNRNGPKRTSLWKSKPAPAAKSPDDLSFDDEDEDEEPAVRFGGTDDDSFGDDDDPASTSRYTSPGLTSSFGAPPPYTGSSYSGSSYEGSYGAAVATAPAATAEAVAHPEPAPVRTAPRRRPENASAAPSLPRKIVASYTCQYLVGAADYIEAHNINDPATGRYIGECGMGVSSKNNVLHNNPNQVIALEVWLYDKLDPRDNLSNTRVLLSEFAADRDFGQAFAQGHEGSVKTFVAQPGTRFQLNGRNLVLEGEILDAEYDREGVFRSVKVVLNVLHK